MKIRWKNLIERAKKGDQDAFRELYEHSYDAVHCTVKSMVQDEDTVLDIVQDAFISGFAGLETFRPPENFIPWMRRIATNKARDWFRKKHDITFSQLAEDGSNLLDLEDQNLDHLPEAVLDRAETSRLIDEILGTLSAQQRIVVGMYYYEGMQIPQVAEALGISENTVKSRLYNGLKKIGAGVEALEKKGTKLYSLAPLPFLIWLFQCQQTTAAGKAPVALLKTIMAQTAAIHTTVAASAAGAAASGSAAGGATAGTAASGSAAGAAASGSAAGVATAGAGTAATSSGILATVGAKIAAAVLAASIVGGGALTTVYYVNQSKPDTGPQLSHSQPAASQGTQTGTVPGTTPGTLPVTGTLPGTPPETGVQETAPGTVPGGQTPSETTDPTTPAMNPTDPTDPTEPTQPTEPAGPTEPTTPEPNPDLPVLTLVYDREGPPKDMYGYGDTLHLTIQLTAADGSYTNIDEAYTNTELLYQLLDSDGKVCFKSTCGPIGDGYAHGLGHHFSNKNMEAGTYYATVQMTVDGVTLQDAYTVNYSGYNGVEAYAVSAYVEQTDCHGELCLSLKAKVTGVDGRPVQRERVQFQILDSNGNVNETIIDYDDNVAGLNTESDGIAGTDITFSYESIAQNYIGTYTLKVWLCENPEIKDSTEFTITGQPDP